MERGISSVWGASLLAPLKVEKDSPSLKRQTFSIQKVQLQTDNSQLHLNMSPFLPALSYNTNSHIIADTGFRLHLYQVHAGSFPLEVKGKIV